MKLYLFIIFFSCQSISQAQSNKQIDCHSSMTRSSLDSIIKLTIKLRNLDTSKMLFTKPELLEYPYKDKEVLTRFIRVKNPSPYQGWAELDSADVNFMVCIRKIYKRFEWNPENLGFRNQFMKNAISFSFPYKSENGNIVILTYNYYNWYENENKFIMDGGFTVALIYEAGNWRIEELTNSIR